MANIKLPWIPEETEENILKLNNPQHRKMTEAVIKEIQTHPDHKKGEKRSMSELQVGAVLGEQLANKLISLHEMDNRILLSKYQTLILAFIKNPDLTQMLLDGQVTAE